jgi:two-component system chemotaxis sensor kinase CheA
VRLEPLAALELRDGAAPAAARALLVVLVVAVGQRLALAVDELAGEQEIVVKNLAAPLRRIGGVAGATVLGDGAVVPVLDVAGLIRLAGRSDRPARGTQPAAPAPAPRARRTILVVDDSITTRLLEKNILEAAGYRVQLATNGQEALDLLASGGLPDLIMSDVAMPVLDGIELTARCAQTCALPGCRSCC